MFDLALAQVSHPDRERDLAIALERRRLLRDIVIAPAAGPQREAPRSGRRPAPTRLMTTER